MAFNVFTRFVAQDDMTNVVRRMNGSVNRLTNSMGAMAVQAGAVALAAVSVKAQLDLDENMRSLSAITGVTGDEFNVFKEAIDRSASSAKMFKGDMAKAYEIIGSAKSELLDNASALAQVTDATVILSKASGDDLASSASNLTGVMNQFNLEANESERAINALAAGSVVGAASITEVNESMKNFGAVANSSNISLEQSIALVEVLSKKNVKGAEAGTKLKSAVLKMQKANLGYESGLFNINDALESTANNMNSLSSEAKKDAYMLKIFGAQNISTGKILLENTKLFEEYTTSVTGTDTAFNQAETKGQALNARLDELVASFKNFTTTTDESNTFLRFLGNGISFISNHMDTLIPVIGTLVGSLITLKLTMMAVNLVMTANPVGAIVVATVALGAAIAILVTNWEELNPVVDDFFEKNNESAWGVILSSLEGMWELLVSVKDTWDAFSVDGFASGIKQLGFSILRFILWPFEKIAALLGSAGWKGAGDWAKKVSVWRDAVRDVSEVNVDQLSADMEAAAVSPESSAQEAMVKREEVTKNNISKQVIEIVDKTAQGVNFKGNNSQLTSNLAY